MFAKTKKYKTAHPKPEPVKLSFVANIQHGDTVTIVTPDGSLQKGKAQLFNDKVQAWILRDPSKEHGGNGIFADDENIVKVTR